jgi:hypothetical protein
VVIYPDNETIEHHRVKDTLICFAYDKDLVQIYDFYCARYENITFKDFMDIGISELQMKIASIPENEPLFTILKSRIINLGKIKDKEERKHWSKLKAENRIPDIYLPNQELDNKLNDKLGGLKDGKRFM